MASTVEALSNFIDGERAASEGETEPVLNPATGEELARAPKSTADDVDRAVQAARRAFDGWSRTTPAQRAQTLLAMADLVEEHGAEIARLEALNAGKPIEAVTNDEIPVMADNLRFFAGAARCLEGLARGRVHGGLHVVHAPRGGRRDRAGDPVELPADDGDLEIRAGAGGGQHGRAQAGGDDADHDHPAGRARR